MAIWRTPYGWKARVQVKGQTYTPGQLFKYKAEAQAWVKAEKELRKKQEPPTVGTFHGLYELIQQYLDDAQARFDHRTYMEKQLCLRRFYEALGDTDPQGITPPQVLEFLRSRAQYQAHGRMASGTANAFNKDRKNLGAFFLWLRRVHGLMVDPVAPIAIGYRMKSVHGG